MPPLQLAGQDAVKLHATPKPVESPMVTTKSQTPVPVPTPVVTRTAMNPIQVDKKSVIQCLWPLNYSRFFVLSNFIYIHFKFRHFILNASLQK
jgi:hypothetical protein